MQKVCGDWAEFICSDDSSTYTYTCYTGLVTSSVNDDQKLFNTWKQCCPSNQMFIMGPHHRDYHCKAPSRLRDMVFIFVSNLWSFSGWYPFNMMYTLLALDICWRLNNFLDFNPKFRTDWNYWMTRKGSLWRQQPGYTVITRLHKGSRPFKMHSLLYIDLLLGFKGDVSFPFIYSVSPQGQFPLSDRWFVKS